MAINALVDKMEVRVLFLGVGAVLIVTCLLGCSCNLNAQGAGISYMDSKQSNTSCCNIVLPKLEQQPGLRACLTPPSAHQAVDQMWKLHSKSTSGCPSQLTRDSAGIVLYCCHVPYNPVQGIPTTLCPSFRDVTALPSLTTLATPADGLTRSKQHANQAAHIAQASGRMQAFNSRCMVNCLPSPPAMWGVWCGPMGRRPWMACTSVGFTGRKMIRHKTSPSLGSGMLP